MTTAETVNPITHNWDVMDLIWQSYKYPIEIEFKLDNVVVISNVRFDPKIQTKYVYELEYETIDVLTDCQFDMAIDGIYDIESEDEVEVSKEAKNDLIDKLYGVIQDEIESYYKIKL